IRGRVGKSAQRQAACPDSHQDERRGHPAGSEIDQELTQLRSIELRCACMATKKNSLVANINRRKRKGISRRKSKTTVSKRSYKQMQKGWPRKKAKRGRKSKKNR